MRRSRAKGPFAAQIQIQGVNLDGGQRARFGLLAGASRRERAAPVLRAPLRGDPARRRVPDGSSFLARSKGRRHLRAAMTAFKNVINWLASPAIAVTLSMIGLVGAMFYKPLWTKKGGAILGLTLVGFFAFSFTDPNFRIVATTPDNVPILGMLFLVGFFFWFAMYQAHLNDARLAKGLPPLEGRQRQEGPFLADLVYARSS